MKKAKILLVLSLIFLMITSYCYATDDSEVLEGEEAGEEITLDADAINALLSGQTTQTDASTQNQTATNSNWTNSDVYICDDNVKITEVIDGNAFVIAKEVTVSGEIGGDLFVMAEKVNIEGGYIYSSIFALAREINIDGIVYDLYGACDTLNLKSNGYVYRDMRVTASNVNLSGRVRRDAYIVSKDINFDTTVGTIIYGNLDYSSDEGEFVAPEGTVEGTVKYNAQKFDTENVSIVTIIVNYVFDLLRTLITTLAIVALLLWLAPKFVEKVGNMDVKKSLASLGIGLFAPIVFVIIGIILLVINVGSGVFVAGMFGYIFLSMIASAIASIFLTKLLAKKVTIEGKIKFILFTLLITAILWLVEQLPLIGGLVSILVWWFGTGAILLNILPKKEAK